MGILERRRAEIGHRIARRIDGRYQHDFLIGPGSITSLPSITGYPLWTPLGVSVAVCRFGWLAPFRHPPAGCQKNAWHSNGFAWQRCRFAWHPANGTRKFDARRVRAPTLRVGPQSLVKMPLAQAIASPGVLICKFDFCFLIFAKLILLRRIANGWRPFS
jgi:hypothetical protein